MLKVWQLEKLLRFRAKNHLKNKKVRERVKTERKNKRVQLNNRKKIKKKRLKKNKKLLLILIKWTLEVSNLRSLDSISGMRYKNKKTKILT